MAKLSKFSKLLIGCALILSAAAVIIEKNSEGYFADRPEAEYLTAEEAALRPYYEQLSDTEKAVYTAMYRGISAHEEEVRFPESINMAAYDKLYTLMLNQESELFCMARMYHMTRKMYSAQISYAADADEYREMKYELETAAENILSAIPEDADDFEKALYIHDYIVDNCVYAHEETERDSTAYGCLVEGRARCEGYSHAFDYLAKALGMQSVLITGESDDGEPHAWNQVEIDGEWYNLDVTWDDYEESGLDYVNFLCTDEKFCLTHAADESNFKAFPCTAKDKNYYVYRDLFVRDLENADRILNREISNGSGEVELEFINNDIYNDFKNKYIIDEQKIFSIFIECGYEMPTIVLVENEEACCLKLNFGIN